MADEKSGLKPGDPNVEQKATEATQTILSRTPDFPPEFKQFLNAYLELHPPRLPLSAIIGGTTLERRTPGAGKPAFYQIANSGESEEEPGWLACNGAAVSRTTYSDLFDAIGTSYGVGDGSTTFNLPQGQDVFLVGRSSGDADFDPVGATGGARTVTLVTSNLPSHNHGAGTLILGNSYLQTTDTIAAVGEISRNYPSQSGAGTIAITGSTANTGSGNAVDTLPPFLTIGGWLIAY